MRMGGIRGLAAVLLLAVLAGCGNYRDTSVPMQPVTRLDLNRYAGTWYEIARYPVWFQSGCTATTATYRVTGAGYGVGAEPVPRGRAGRAAPAD